MQSNMQLNQGSKQHFNLSKTSLNKKNFKHIDPKTHTHTKQVESILYFKNKLRQFSKHILTHVFIVMAKSHCTYICIKISKEYYVLCMKNIARLHKYLHVVMILRYEKITLTHTQS